MIPPDMWPDFFLLGSIVLFIRDLLSSARRRR